MTQSYNFSQKILFCLWTLDVSLEWLVIRHTLGAVSSDGKTFKVIRLIQWNGWNTKNPPIRGLETVQAFIPCCVHWLGTQRHSDQMRWDGWRQRGILSQRHLLWFYFKQASNAFASFGILFVWLQRRPIKHLTRILNWLSKLSEWGLKLGLNVFNLFLITTK